MGFYGNITNTNRTQFVFDKVYQSRSQMDDQVNKDGIYIGRYVLVEYGYNGSYKRLYKLTEDNVDKFYTSRTLTEDTRVKYSNVPTEDENFVVHSEIIFILDKDLKQQFYTCIGADENGYAQFEFLMQPPSDAGTYFDNYYDDYNKYHFDRGYDSTVWQKVYLDDTEKYVMIAELNSVVPTFDLTIDPPTEQPIVPHFDKDSTSVYYRLHVQPNWGFRIKPADNQYTDIDGKAIYYNDAGFKKDTRTHVDIDDYIDLTKTKSGNEYNTHNPDNPNEVAKADDIQELSIILPSIGNTISDVWDILYGQNRNLDIGWDSYEGLRLVHEDNGFSYSTDEIETVAGCINSVHDLMGMIIVNDVTDVDLADTDKIYYGDLGGKNLNGYYIKEKSYEYTKFNENELEDYLKEITPVQLTQFEANKYYTKNNNGFALVTTSEYKPGTNYYSLDITDVELDGSYGKNKYFYLEESTLNYVKDQNDLPNENVQYYDIALTPVTNGNDNLFYHPTEHIQNPDDTFTGLFYKDKTNNKVYKIDGVDDPIFDPTGGYFIGESYTFEEKLDENLEYVTVYTFKNEKPVNLIEFKYDENDKTGNYYYRNEAGNYICLTDINSINDAVIYGKLVLTAKKRFYEPNLYYYKSGNDFIYATGSFNVEASYTILNGTEEAIKNTFYEPNKYYYKDNLAIDRLDTNPVMTKDREYFLKYFAYIYEDTRGILDKGAEWNSNVRTIPKEITLAKREEKYIWKELVGFARTLNTVHGLIVRINSLLKFDDYLTRDNKTVQGCINLLNDIINTFATLLPGEILIVDKYGRVTSSPYVTDDWIDLKVNNDPVNHQITLNHEYKSVPNTTSVKDVNGNGDTINLYTPKVDIKGHVVGNNIETVTLPYGYKTIKVANSDEAAEAAQVTAERGQSADNTQDTINFNASNKWIKFDNSEEDIIKIGHKLSEAVENANKQFGLLKDVDITDLDQDNTFEVPNFKFDEAGHIVDAQTHTITIPEAFTKIKVVGGSALDTNTAAANDPVTMEPDTLTDELTFTSGNRWIVLTADKENDTISISHGLPGGKVEVIGEEKSETLEYEQFFTMPFIYKDNSGHIAEYELRELQMPTQPSKTLLVGLNGQSLLNQNLTINEAFEELEDAILKNQSANSNSITQLNTDLSALKGTVDSHTHLIEINARNISNHDNLLNQYQRDIANNAGDISSLNNLVKQCQTDINNNTGDITNLENKLNNQIDRINNNASDIATEQARAIAAEDKIRDLIPNIPSYPTAIGYYILQVKDDGTAEWVVFDYTPPSTEEPIT